MNSAWVAVALALLYLAFGWLWKRPFVFGAVAGVYWLLIVFDWTVLPLAGLTGIGFVIALIVWVVQAIGRSRNAPAAHSVPNPAEGDGWFGFAHHRFGNPPRAFHDRLALAAGVLLLASIGLLGASFPAIVSPTTPLDSAFVWEHMYYLAAHGALVDVNYGLYECDRVGVMCRQIHRTGDFPLSTPHPSLAYNPTTGELTIESETGEIMYTQRAP